MADTFDGERCVVVVGGGASGTLVATHLLTSLGSRHRVELIDPTPGRLGPAYATTDPRHLLNVPASGMTALPREPDHFLRWLRRHHRADFQPQEFAPRAAYARYLEDLLQSASDFPSSARLVRRTDEVTDLTPQGPGFRVSLQSGEVLDARAVVLAPGAVPTDTWAPPALTESDAWVIDPWAGPLDVPESGDVLLVGSGLTMVDLAISLDTPGRTVHVVSRTDTLPKRHVVPTTPPVPPPPGITRLHGLDAVERAVRTHVRTTVEQTGDWRAALDGLRPVTWQLWGALGEDDKQAFVHHLARTWDTHRHRMSPVTAERFEAVLTSGRLVRHTGTVTAARPSTATEGVVVTLTDGTELEVTAVLNCTGPSTTIAGSALLSRLAASGIVRPGPVGLGVDTAEEGRVLGTCRRQDLYAVGTLRKGNLWESTAVPEIREQAWDVARAVARSLQGTSGTQRTDLYGLALSTNSVAAGWYDRALARLLRLQDGVDDALDEAVDVDPGFAHAHAARALLAFEGGTAGDAFGSLRAAHAAAGKRSLDDREASFLDAVSVRLRGDEAAGAAALLRHIRIFPRDALALSVAVPTVAFGGVTAGSQTADLVEWLGKTYGDDWWYAGQLAFVRQDQRRWDEAESLASHALSVEPASGHAVHARAHVFYETGHHTEGLTWLDGWIAEHGPRAQNRSHFEWHAALHELILDDVPAARVRYERALRPDFVGAARAVVDSGSLLWRGRMTESWPGTLRAPALRHEVPPTWLTAPPSPFAAMHTALTLAVTDDAPGLIELQRYAERHEDPTQREVVAPLAQVLLHVVEEDWTAAARLLPDVLRRSGELGGSAAQREVLEETHVHVLTRLGRTEEAARVLDVRLDRRPSPLDQRRLRALTPANPQHLSPA